MIMDDVFAELADKLCESEKLDLSERVKALDNYSPHASVHGMQRGGQYVLLQDVLDMLQRG